MTRLSIPPTAQTRSNVMCHSEQFDLESPAQKSSPRLIGPWKRVERWRIDALRDVLDEEILRAAGTRASSPNREYLEGRVSGLRAALYMLGEITDEDSQRIFQSVNAAGRESAAGIGGAAC